MAFNLQQATDNAVDELHRKLDEAIENQLAEHNQVITGLQAEVERLKAEYAESERVRKWGYENRDGWIAEAKAARSLFKIPPPENGQFYSPDQIISLMTKDPAPEPEKPTEPSGRRGRYQVDPKFDASKLGGNLPALHAAVVKFRALPGRWADGVSRIKRELAKADINGVKPHGPTIQSGREFKQQALNNKTLLLLGDPAALKDVIATVNLLLDNASDRSYPIDKAGNYAKSYKAEHDQVGVKRFLYTNTGEDGEGAAFDPSFGHTDYAYLERDLFHEALADNLDMLNDNKATDPEAKKAYDRLLDFIENHFMKRTEYLAQALYKSKDNLKVGHVLRHPTVARLRFYKTMLRITGNSARYGSYVDRLAKHLLAEFEEYSYKGSNGAVWPHFVNPLEKEVRGYKGADKKNAHNTVYTEESNYSVLFDALEPNPTFTLKQAGALAGALMMVLPIKGWSKNAVDDVAGNLAGQAPAGKTKDAVYFADGGSLPLKKSQAAQGFYYKMLNTQRGGSLMAAPWSTFGEWEKTVDLLDGYAVSGRGSLKYTKLMAEMKRLKLLPS